jgi:hypothetical protein
MSRSTPAAEFGAHALETAGDVVRAQSVGSLVQHAGRQVGHARLVRGIAAGAGVEHHAHLQHGQLAAFDEIDARAVVQGPVLDFGTGEGLGYEDDKTKRQSMP